MRLISKSHNMALFKVQLHSAVEHYLGFISSDGIRDGFYQMGRPMQGHLNKYHQLELEAFLSLEWSTILLTIF